MKGVYFHIKKQDVQLVAIIIKTWKDDVVIRSARLRKFVSMTSTHVVPILHH